MTWEVLRDSHKGEVGILVGNGPSLRRTPPELLHGRPSFGSNRCYLLPFTPRYYVCVNPLVLEQFLPEIIKLESDALFLTDLHAPVGGNVFPLHSVYSDPFFSKDPAAGIFEGWTVSYVAMQLMFFMGFKTVLLVGLDHRYVFEGQPNQKVRAVGSDPNHFDPNYFGPGVQWNNPDLRRSEASYRLARDVFEDDGRMIVNLTPGTALGVFKRESWRKWL